MSPEAQQRTVERARGRIRELLRSGQSGIAGGYLTIPGGGRIHLGSGLRGGITGNYPAPAGSYRHVLAHEIGHALDGPNRDYSRSPEWVRIHNNEINPRGKLK